MQQVNLEQELEKRGMINLIDKNGKNENNILCSEFECISGCAFSSLISDSYDQDKGTIIAKVNSKNN